MYYIRVYAKTPYNCNFTVIYSGKTLYIWQINVFRIHSIMIQFSYYPLFEMVVM